MDRHDILTKRSHTLAAIRNFFYEREYLEMETPVALRFPGQEPYLNPVPVVLTDDTGKTYNFHLRTSPEYAMKKLLGEGFTKIFNLGPCFRDRESFGGTHEPQFTMLEWYSTNMDYRRLMDEVDDLLKVAAEPWGRMFALPSQRFSMHGLFLKQAGIDLDTWQKIPTIEYESRFFDVFLNKIEPTLPPGPAIVYDYPVQLGALARRRVDNPNYVERFELYIDGLEMANAFGELLDVQEQRARFTEDQANRTARGEMPFPFDEEFLQALPRIPEPTSGIALGVDRLIMSLAQTRRIEDVITYPH